MGSIAVPTEAVLEKKSPHSTLTNNDSEKQTHVDAEELVVDSTSAGESSRRHSSVRIVSLVSLALFILGWWISSITLQATRHRWVVQSIFAWAFILIIAFHIIPNSVTRPVEAAWFSLIEGPFFRIPKYIRFTLGWLSLIAIVLGSAFGFKLENVCVPVLRITDASCFPDLLADPLLSVH
jgi:CNT family concentrative nucleoside transporter